MNLDELISRFRKPKESISVYLNTAAESLFYEPHLSAFELYANAKSSGSEGRSMLTKIEQETKELVSQLIHVPGKDIVFLSNTSRCLDVAIKSIDWQPGDNVVFSETEFLTTEFTGALLGKMGMEVRVVPSTRGVVELGDYASMIDTRTRLVVASAVSYKTGLILDVEGLGKIVRASGALLFVDGIQGLGSVPVDATAADFFASGTFKWLFGMHGVAIFYVNNQILKRLKIPYVGYHSVSEMFGENRTREFDLWPDARRFQEGLPNYAGIALLRSSLQAIKDVGIESIWEKNEFLLGQLMAELVARGIKPFGFDQLDRHSPIVAFESKKFEQIGKSLIDSGIIVWAKDGRVRLSPHFYNSTEDIRALAVALDKVL
jgi:selenocysteine lyase/cysteine desulfurase